MTDINKGKISEIDSSIFDEPTNAGFAEDLRNPVHAVRVHTVGSDTFVADDDDVTVHKSSITFIMGDTCHLSIKSPYVKINTESEVFQTIHHFLVAVADVDGTDLFLDKEVYFTMSFKDDVWTCSFRDAVGKYLFGGTAFDKIEDGEVAKREWFLSPTEKPVRGSTKDEREAYMGMMMMIFGDESMQEDLITDMMGDNVSREDAEIQFKEVKAYCEGHVVKFCKKFNI